MSKDAAARKAAKKLKGGDRLGHLGQVVATAAGAAAGASAAGTVAGAAGATTLLGSTTLASALGGVFVVSTPVGWVAGCAIAGAGAAYGISRFVRSSGRHDRIREEIRKKLERRGLRRKRISIPEELSSAAKNAVRRGDITATQAKRLMDLVSSGKLAPALAEARVQALASSAGNGVAQE